MIGEGHTSINHKPHSEYVLILNSSHTDDLPDDLIDDSLDSVGRDGKSKTSSGERMAGGGGVDADKAAAGVQKRAPRVT